MVRDSVGVDLFRFELAIVEPSTVASNLATNLHHFGCFIRRTEVEAWLLM
jgi:hypothetical protein